jgi:hypothetical protein
MKWEDGRGKTQVEQDLRARRGWGETAIFYYSIE